MHSGKRAIMTLALMTASLTVPVMAPAMANVENGVAAWAQGQYAAAVQAWEGPAAKGDADARYNLAQAYLQGKGVKADRAKAEALLRKAAEQDHPLAADHYGLLLYDRGEKAAALPYLRTAAARGDPRAQYLLGVAHFQGDLAQKDWVQAYALIALARAGGLAEAGLSLEQMDQMVTPEQQQEASLLANAMAEQVRTIRARQLAALNPRKLIGVPVMTARAPTPAPAQVASPWPWPWQAAEPRAPTAKAPTPPATPPQAPPIKAAPAVAAPPKAVAAKPAPPAATPPAPAASIPVTKAAPSVAMAGQSSVWHVQLGIFAIRSNAEAMWNKVQGRPELAGRSRLMLTEKSRTRLLAHGFASQSEAQNACRALSRTGIACLVTRYQAGRDQAAKP